MTTASMDSVRAFVSDTEAQTCAKKIAASVSEPMDQTKFRKAADHDDERSTKKQETIRRRSTGAISSGNDRTFILQTILVWCYDHCTA